MDDLSSFDGDFVDQTTISADDWGAERKDVVFLCNLLVAAGGRVEAEPFASDSVEVREVFRRP